ncbi:MAG TPA: methyltransferase domain-containing protein [Afipia sp.]
MVYLENADGIFVPPVPMQHRADEYDEAGFERLKDMQSRHFWYIGRHRFLLRAVASHVNRKGLTGVDLGGGCGGWISYVSQRLPNVFSELALADSSIVALTEARGVLPPETKRYQVNLMDLGWSKRWDVAFLLDVIEHIPDAAAAMREAREAVKPGGLVFVSVPALDFFWSYNDELAHHQRRYSRDDFARLAKDADLELVDARYFMFFLSPLYWLSRQKSSTASDDAHKAEIQANTHRIPSRFINQSLAMIFSAETPIGHWIRFPWGTSLLGVFRRMDA